jgi:hypothetical protein
MKRKIYIALFVLLGLLLQFLLHALIEIWYINLLLKDFPKYGLGLNWNQWLMIHHALSLILVAVGAVWGFYEGRFWWRHLYELKGKG